MLIESACSVDRVEEALSTLLPMLPEIQYFRFNPGMLLTLELHIMTKRKGGSVNGLGLPGASVGFVNSLN